jgi:hypothetical protein
VCGLSSDLDAALPAPGDGSSPAAGYKMIFMRDVIFQPGTSTYDPSTPKRNTGPWTSAKGIKTAYKNVHQDATAILRIH